MTAREAVARILAGQDPSPRGWVRAREIADEVVSRMESRHVPMVREPGAGVRPERRPCKGCGKPIEPGRAYVVDGPFHVRCGGAP